LFRLALACGRWDVDQLRNEIPDELFDEWMDFYATDPWGGERADLLAGIVTANLCNLWAKSSFAPKDFMPDWDPTETLLPQSAEELNLKVDAFLKWMKGNKRGE